MANGFKNVLVFFDINCTYYKSVFFKTKTDLLKSVKRLPCQPGMPFTKEQDSFMPMAHFRSDTLNLDGNWSYTLQSCIKQFVQQYPDVIIDYEGKSTGRPTVLTQDVVADIQERIDQSPKKSVAQLSQQTGLSVGTCHKALRKNLNMYSYKVTVVQKLYPHDYQQRVWYCQWFNENLNNNDLDLTFFTGEAWFHLSGYVNSQNYRTWSTENPREFVETELHPLKRLCHLGPIFLICSFVLVAGFLLQFHMLYKIHLKNQRIAEYRVQLSELYDTMKSVERVANSTEVMLKKLKRIAANHKAPHMKQLRKIS